MFCVEFGLLMLLPEDMNNWGLIYANNIFNSVYLFVL